MRYLQTASFFGLLRSQAIVSDQNGRLNSWKVHFVVWPLAAPNHLAEKNTTDTLRTKVVLKFALSSIPSGGKIRTFHLFSFKCAHFDQK